MHRLDFCAFVGEPPECSRHDHLQLYGSAQMRPPRPEQSIYEPSCQRTGDRGLGHHPAPPSRDWDDRQL